MDQVDPDRGAPRLAFLTITALTMIKLPAATMLGFSDARRGTFTEPKKATWASCQSGLFSGFLSGG